MRVGTRIDETLAPMSELSMASLIEGMAKEACYASRQMARSTRASRTEALHGIADAIEAAGEEIVAANEVDLAAADVNGITSAMRDRLELDRAGVAKLAAAIREVAAQRDPLGGVEDEIVRPNGLRVGRMRIPLGVVAMIYESRPNVTADAAVLCLKAGNAIVLRGGSEAIHSNRAIAAAIRTGLEASELPVDAVQLIPVVDRAAIDVLLVQEAWIDLVIPRGGEGLIRAVTEKSRIPVLQHYKGVCHLFIDASAPVERAVEIATNAKVQTTRRMQFSGNAACPCGRRTPGTPSDRGPADRGRGGASRLPAREGCTVRSPDPSGVCRGLARRISQSHPSDPYRSRPRRGTRSHRYTRVIAHGSHRHGRPRQSGDLCWCRAIVDGAGEREYSVRRRWGTRTRGRNRNLDLEAARVRAHGRQRTHDS